MSEGAGEKLERFRGFLDRSLFPPAPPQAARFAGWEAGVVLVSLVALAAVLQLFRLGPSTALNSLWAEDGPVFLGGAMTHGFFDSLTSPYAEYLVVLPRMIGEIGAAVPLHDAPLAMNLTTVIVIALSGMAVWFASAGHIHNPYLRALPAAMMVLCPVSTVEAVATPTNIAWYTTFAVFWLLFWRPKTTWGACLGGLLILVTGLSTPGTLFFAPIALLRAVTARGRRDAIVVGSYWVGVAIQLFAMAVNTEEITGDVWTGKILTAFLQRVVDGSILGLDLAGETWLDWGWPFLIAIVVAFVAFMGVMLVRSSSNRLFAGIAIVTSVAVFLASCYTRALGDVLVWHTDVYTDFGGRYTIVPTLLLISAAIALIDSHYRSSRKRFPVIAIAAAALLLTALVTSFDVRGTIGRGGPHWDDALQASTAECEAKGLAEVPAYIAPEGWAVNIPCDSLVSTSGAKNRAPG